jgi:hypothetical protein
MTPGYGGPTVRFENNRTYHVVLKYEEKQKTVSMRVSEKTTGREIWSYYVNIGTSLSGMNRIFLGSIGDYGMTGRTAEGYIYNVRLSADVPVTPATTGITIQPTTPPVTFTTRPTTGTTTGIPAPAPTPASPSSALIPSAALGITVIAFLCPKIRPKQ